MPLRLLIQDELVYEGDPIAVPRVDDVVHHGGQVVPVEAATSHTPTLARRFVTKTLQGWGQDELIDDSLLVVSELTANAITHVASDVTVSLVRHAHGVRLTVGDSSTAAPTPRQSDVTADGGRGLTLVHALAARWGYQSADEGKYVWADIDGR